MPIQVIEVLLDVRYTYEDQPREFPEMPEGWISSVNDAIDSNDDRRLYYLGKQLATAHSQYPADFERNPWLAALRQALRDEAKNQ
jgi:hypothetical protein